MLNKQLSKGRHGPSNYIMNDQDRSELEALKQRQTDLLRQLTELAHRLEGKEAVLENVRRDLQAIRTNQSSLEQLRSRLATEVGQFEARVSTNAPATTSAQPVAPKIEAPTLVVPAS